MSVLGATAQGLYWMFRSLERADTMTRVIEATLRVSYSDADMGQLEFESIVTSAGLLQAWDSCHDLPPAQTSSAEVVDFLLRDEANPSSLRSAVTQAHANARRVRTALSRETFEAMNQATSQTLTLLATPTPLADLPETLAAVRRLLAAVHGAHAVTAMRNENFTYARLGTFIERADSTARILNAKSVALTTTDVEDIWLENLHFDTLLRSVAAHRAFRWAHSGSPTGPALAEFLIRSPRMPRSLAFCTTKLAENIGHLANDYGTEAPSAALVQGLLKSCTDREADSLIAEGLHEFLNGFLNDLGALGAQIATDYRFEP